MKKTITICLFMVITLTSQAQAKQATRTKTPAKKAAKTASTAPASQKSPTKEETISFIAKCMKETEGLKTYGQMDEKRSVEDLYIKNIFSASEIFRKKEVKNYKRGRHIETQIFTNLTWQNVLSIELDVKPSIYQDDDVATIELKFSSKIKRIDQCQKVDYEITCGDTYYRNNLIIVIPNNRGVACEKALNHLINLYKEENKDPFQN